MPVESGFAVDSHLHAHWPTRFPYVHNRTSYIEPDNEAASAESLFPTLHAHGLTHALIVQPGAYGTDNSATIAAIAESGGRAKGIASMALDAPDEEFVALKAGGIVGARLSLITTDPQTFERDGIDAFMGRCRDHDFFLEVFAPAARWPAILPQIIASRARIIVEHVGYPILADGIDEPGFQALLDYGRSSEAVIKVSGWFRLTQMGTPYRDVEPFVLAAIDAFGPDRCLWGSDWPLLDPHLGSHDRPYPWQLDYGTEIDTFRRWVPDEAKRRAILWETPARLFGFAG